MHRSAALSPESPPNKRPRLLQTGEDKEARTFPVNKPNLSSSTAKGRIQGPSQVTVNRPATVQASESARKRSFSQLGAPRAATPEFLDQDAEIERLRAELTAARDEAERHKVRVCGMVSDTYKSAVLK